VSVRVVEELAGRCDLEADALILAMPTTLAAAMGLLRKQ
jgi:hypothetical protein